MKLLLFIILSVCPFQNILLEKRLVLDDKIEILIPKEFKEMTSEMLDYKYKGQNKPTLVYTNEAGTVNIAFNHLPNVANDNLIEQYKNSVKASFKNSFPTAIWKGDGTKMINGRKVGFIKLVTEAIDQKIYNSLFITHWEGTLLIGTFNCTEKLLQQWEKPSEEIIESLLIK